MHTEQKILILFNPISGCGKGAFHAQALAACFRQKEFSVSVELVSRAAEQDLTGISLIVIVGGDGSLQSVLPLVLQNDVPICMYPAGNQSLFAREFGYSKNYQRFVSDVMTGEVSEYYVGEANGTLFFSMLSIGFDSDVVNRVNTRRHGPIGIFTYPLAVLGALFCHSAPQLRITIDNKIVIDKQKVYVIVANCPQYALGLRILPEADPRSECLVMRIIPYSLPIQLILKVAYETLIGHWRKTSIYLAREIKIEAMEQPSPPVQADGDMIGYLPTEIRKHQQRLKVLFPSGKNHRL